MRSRLAVFLCVLCVFCGGLSLAGCGNVYLWGDGLTAAETSAMDAYNAFQRAQPSAVLPDANAAPADPNASLPMWEKAYLEENYKQWRSFVRSANKDLTWGPKLRNEQ